MKKIVDQIVILAEAFGLPIGQPRLKIYIEALSDLPIDAIKKAVWHIIKTRPFAGNLPTIAEIREAAEQKIPLDTQAAVAWEKFKYAMAHHCPYDSVSFDDPIITRIIMVWGDWPSMGEWPSDKSQWWRREFMALYQAYAKSPHPAEVPKYLVGLTEYGNSLTGWLDYIPQPVLIAGAEGKITTTQPKRLTRVKGGLDEIQKVGDGGPGCQASEWPLIRAVAEKDQGVDD